MSIGVVENKIPDRIPISLVVIGVKRMLVILPWTRLLDALRDHLGLTGTKKGCDHGQCGACTVLVEGRRINSSLPARLVVGMPPEFRLPYAGIREILRLLAPGLHYTAANVGPADVNGENGIVAFVDP